MPLIHAYLMFNGNCREAMTFYEQSLGGELTLITFGQVPEHKGPPGNEDKIMHATLKTNDFLLMASDALPAKTTHAGNNVQLSLSFSNNAEMEKTFQALVEKGTVTMPLQDVFWGARFGMATDQFGICWMFNFDKQ